MSEDDQFREILRGHLIRVRAAARDNEFIDLRLAERLHSALHDALGHWGDYSDAQRSVVADAVAYLARTDDAEDDLRSPIGFDDDAEVVEAALRRVRG